MMKIGKVFFSLTLAVSILAFEEYIVYRCRNTIQILDANTSSAIIAGYLEKQLKKSPGYDIYPESCTAVQKASAENLENVAHELMKSERTVFVQVRGVHFKYNGRTRTFELEGCHLTYNENIIQYKPKEAVVDYLSKKGNRKAKNANSIHLCEKYNKAVRDADMEFSPFFGSPILLIPGLGASVLHGRNLNATEESFLKKGWNLAWAPFSILTGAEKWAENMKLIFNKENGSTRNQNGVEVEVPYFGYANSTEPMKLVPYFGDFVNKAVKDWGYVEGLSILAAGYDFRKAPNEAGEYFKKIKLLIETMRRIHGGRKVVILAHSMGNLYTKYFLQIQTQEWKDANIQMFISVNAPWGGSVMAMNTFIKGDFGEESWKKAIARRVLNATKTFPSLVFLLPKPEFWSSNKPLVMTPTKNYTVDDYQEFFQDLNNTDAYEIYKLVGKLVDMNAPPGVEVHCIYASGSKTVSGYNFTGPIPGARMQKVYADGDGLVETISAHGCSFWFGKQQQPVILKPFQRVEHSEILRYKKFFDYVHNAVFGTGA